MNRFILYVCRKFFTPLVERISVVKLDEVQRLETRRNNKKLFKYVSNSHYGCHRIINWVAT